MRTDNYHRNDRLSYVHMFLLVVLLIMPTPCNSAVLTTGNILVTTSGELREYTLNGALVQSITLPSEGGAAGGSVWHPSGDLYIMKDNWGSKLYQLSHNNGAWTYQDFAGWDSRVSLGRGMIATDGRYIYAPDESSANDLEPSGIVRFDRHGGDAARISEGEFRSVSVGLDGMVYALSQLFGFVRVINPLTAQVVRDIQIGHLVDPVDLAVDYDGSIFLVGTEGELVHVNPEGEEIAAVTLPGSMPPYKIYTWGVDLRSDGVIVVGHQFDGFILVERTLTQDPVYIPGAGGVNFISFVDFNPIVGDTDYDADVDDFDLIKAITHYTGSLENGAGSQGYANGDTDYDQDVDDFDLINMISGYTGSLSPTPAVPEPGTVSVLAMGGIACMWRRHSRSAKESYQQ